MDEWGGQLKMEACRAAPSDISVVNLTSCWNTGSKDATSVVRRGFQDARRGSLVSSAGGTKKTKIRGGGGGRGGKSRGGEGRTMGRGMSGGGGKDKVSRERL